MRVYVHAYVQACVSAPRHPLHELSSLWSLHSSAEAWSLCNKRPASSLDKSKEAAAQPKPRHKLSVYGSAGCTSDRSTAAQTWVAHVAASC